jgi:hypothetical protein
MILGDHTHFVRDHFEAHAGTAPPYLCELVVHCLELVSLLEHHGLAFRFKGGNSLLVLLEDPQRFSIDVDIVTTESKENMIALVERVVAASRVFHRFESRAPKTKPWLPMISFKLFFESHYQPPEESFVMLDAVLEPPPYPGVRKTVRCGAIYRSATEVEVPSISGLIGDKLLTLGPSTLGIPLGKSKEAQRLKHVFDVALLSRQGYDAAAVRASVDGCLAQENRIQGSTHDWPTTRADTLRFLEAALAHETQPSTAEPMTYLGEITTGFDPFRKHLFRTQYTWSRLREDASEVLRVIETIGQ